MRKVVVTVWVSTSAEQDAIAIFMYRVMNEYDVLTCGEVASAIIGGGNNIILKNNTTAMANYVVMAEASDGIPIDRYETEIVMDTLHELWYEMDYYEYGIEMDRHEVIGEDTIYYFTVQ
jgi:hypothetical protein